MATVLLAENDPYTLDVLPRILSDRFPDLAIETCTSAEELRRKSELASYSTIAMSPVLLQAYRLLKFKRPQQFASPLLITAGKQDRSSAFRILEREAFDLIVKPIIPEQAAQTIRLALWQNKLLHLLASKERAWSKFQQHMEAFPHDLRVEMDFRKKLEMFDRTLQTVSTSIRLMLSVEEEGSFFDLAASVERHAKEQALERLFILCQEGPTQEAQHAAGGN